MPLLLFAVYLPVNSPVLSYHVGDAHPLGLHHIGFVAGIIVDVELGHQARDVSFGGAEFRLDYASWGCDWDLVGCVEDEDGEVETEGQGQEDN